MAIWKSQVSTYFSQLASKGKGTYKLSETRNAPLAHVYTRNLRGTLTFLTFAKNGKKRKRAFGQSPHASRNAGGTYNPTYSECISLKKSSETSED